MGRKPKYKNPQSIIDTFFAAVSDSYNSPTEVEQGRDGKKKQELLAEEFQISSIKVRKILITTGELKYGETAQIQKLLAEGMKMYAVAEKMSLSISSVNSLLPYSKGVYKLSEVSAAADRTAIYRARKAALAELKDYPSNVNLWKTVCIFAGYPFQTSGRGGKGGAKFKYVVSEPGSSGGRHYDGEEVEGFGNELFIVQNGEKMEKGISRSSVDYAFKIALEGEVKGPKSLKVYGSSYIFVLFVRFGLVTPAE